MRSPMALCTCGDIFPIAANVVLPFRVGPTHWVDALCPYCDRRGRFWVTAPVWLAVRRLWVRFVDQEVSWFAQRLASFDDLAGVAAAEGASDDR